MLIIPGTTAFADTPSHGRFAEGYLLEAADIEGFFSHCIEAPRRNDWRFAPLEADDLDGVAPACVVRGAQALIGPALSLAFSSRTP